MYKKINKAVKFLLTIAKKNTVKVLMFIKILFSSKDVHLNLKNQAKHKL